MSQKRLNALQQRIFFLSPQVEQGEQEMNVQDIELMSGLGKGTFGQVYKVRHKVTKLEYAAKVIEKQSIIQTNMVKQIGNEMKIMYQLNHKHIIKLYNHFEHEDKLYLILQYAVGGSLYEKLISKKKLDEESVKKYFSQLVEAIEYCHQQYPPIIHRDIKPENILLDENNQIKLADFGWANFNDENVKRQTYCGSLVYLSPEMILKSVLLKIHSYMSKSTMQTYYNKCVDKYYVISNENIYLGHDINLDLWSMGVLLYELLSGQLPFTDDDQITQKQYEENIKNLRLRFPANFPQLAQDLVRKLLKFQPKERLQLQDIKKHSWISQYFDKSRPSDMVEDDDNIYQSIEIQKPKNSQIINNQIAQQDFQQAKELSQQLRRLEAKLNMKEEEFQQYKLLMDSQNNQNGNVNQRFMKAMEEEKQKHKQQIDQYWEKLKEKEQIIQKQKFDLNNLQDQLKNIAIYKEEKKELENQVQQFQNIIDQKNDLIDELRQKLQRDSIYDSTQDSMRESLVVGNQQTQIKEFMTLINDLKQKIDNYREIAVNVQDLEMKNFSLQQELQKWQDQYEYFKQEQQNLIQDEKENEIDKVKRWKFEQDQLREEKHEEKLREYDQLLTVYKKKDKDSEKYQRENTQYQQKFEIERQINQNIEKDLESYKHLYKNIQIEVNQKIKIIKEKDTELQMLYQKQSK